MSRRVSTGTKEPREVVLKSGRDHFLHVSTGTDRGDTLVRTGPLSTLSTGTNISRGDALIRVGLLSTRVYWYQQRRRFNQVGTTYYTCLLGLIETL